MIEMVKVQTNRIPTQGLKPKIGIWRVGGIRSPNKQNPDSGIETVLGRVRGGLGGVVQTNRIPTQGLKLAVAPGLGLRAGVQTNRIPTQGLKPRCPLRCALVCARPNKQNPDSGIETS